MKKLGQDYYMEILIEMKLNIWFNPVKATIPDKTYLLLQMRIILKLSSF